MFFSSSLLFSFSTSSPIGCSSTVSAGLGSSVVSAKFGSFTVSSIITGSRPSSARSIFSATKLWSAPAAISFDAIFIVSGVVLSLANLSVIATIPVSSAVALFFSNASSPSSTPISAIISDTDEAFGLHHSVSPNFPPS